ncbi:triadin, putative [Pediculus humanus corporis]|uniref:Triadin, putative n=1 Tax=Pediculus humanus subsp. corporis TaxID=121224 RepID=E0VLU0_PEDHC|nr:triadin, putative [Pediculus humanus corporis]EEB14346.1 triadin, putative [Pediculus humanus corporis]
MGVSEVTCSCKSWGKQVFQMEQIKAEKSVWHKNCFRCKECNKQLSVDTYSSNEGVLYCKPHFKELFKPKAVMDDETEPTSDKSDLGLDELASLNVKSRYQVFEKGEETTNSVLEKSPSNISVKKSPSILSKLAKFQKKGIDVGVRDEDLNGLPVEQSSTSSEDEEDETEETSASKQIVKSKKIKERPMSFSKMDDVKSVWENGVTKTREEMREERKAEIHQIRSKLFMGKQVKMKEAYEQAVRDSENSSPKKSIEVRCEKAKSIKECFEKGEPLNNVDDDNNENEEKKKVVEDDLSLFEAGISKKSRSMFLELDKSAKTQAATVVKKPSIKTSGPASKPQETHSKIPCPTDPPVMPKCKALMKIFMYPQDPQRHQNTGKLYTFKGIGLWKDRTNRSKKKINFYCEIKSEIDRMSAVRRFVKNQVSHTVTSDNIVKSSDTVEDVQIETADISSKFKFFESYKEPEREKKRFRITPPREGQVKEESPEKEIARDPNVIRSCDKVDNEIIRTNTTAKMLSLFRQMEEKTEEIPEGPKPLKRFTPPPDYKQESEEDSGESEESGEEEDEEEQEEEHVETNSNIIRASDKVEDEYLKQAANAARAKQLRAKFEKWEEKEKAQEENSIQNKINGSVVNNSVNTENSENVEVTSIECTKSLRARFESMKGESDFPKEKLTRPKVNRFVVCY